MTIKERNILARRCITCEYCIHIDTDPKCEFVSVMVKVELSHTCKHWKPHKRYDGIEYASEYNRDSTS